MSWENLSDFWDDYNFKKIIEIIWNNYEEYNKEQTETLQEIDDSKSIITAPYKLKRRWKKLKWEIIRDEEENIDNLNLLTDFSNVILVDIPSTTKDEGEKNILDNEYSPIELIGIEDNLSFNIFDIPFENDPSTPYNPIKFMSDPDTEIDYNLLEPYIKDEILEIWVKEYYIHNKLVLELYGELVGLTKTIYNLDFYSEMYFNMVKALWFVLVNGPTIKNVKIGLYLFFNLPISLKENSEIEIWEAGHIKLISGEEWYFNESLPLINGYYDSENNYIEITGPGDYIPRFTFLVDGPEMMDYLNSPDWWIEKSYFTSGVDIEKYSTTYIEVPENSFETGERDLTVLSDFLKRTVPQYVKFAMALRIDLDSHDGTDEEDVTDGSISLVANNTLSEIRPRFEPIPTYGDNTKTFKFNGEIKFDNFGDELKIRISDHSVPEEINIWRIY